MFIRFEVENLLSFNTSATFEMIAGKVFKYHKNHEVRVAGLSVLRGAIVYGANAAGKSNFFKAIGLFLGMLRTRDCSCLIGKQFRGDGESKKKMRMELTYSHRERIFTYSVVSDGISVIEETLSLEEDRDSVLLFERTGSNIKPNPEFLSDEWYQWRTLEDSALYLTKLEADGIRVPENKNKIKGADYIIDALSGLSNIEVLNWSSAPKAGVLYRLSEKESFHSFIKELMVKADVGITGINWSSFTKKEQEELVSKLPEFLTMRDKNGYIFLNHRPELVLEVENGQVVKVQELRIQHGDRIFKLQEESDGTQRLIELAPMLYELKTGAKAYFVDEIDCHLHPMLAKEILQMFMSVPETQSQLVVSAHDTNLLSNEIWRPDEVWFAEKRADRSSDLYSLYQFHPRFDKNLAKGYLQGAYGAIPLPRDFGKIFEK